MGARQEPIRSSPRERIVVMVANIGRELREMGTALADRRGDRVAEPRNTAAALAHPAAQQP